MLFASYTKKRGPARKAVAFLLSCLILIWPVFGSFAAAGADNGAKAGTIDENDVKPIEIVLDGGIMAIGAELGTDGEAAKIDGAGLGSEANQGGDASLGFEAKPEEAAFSKLSGTVENVSLELLDAYGNYPIIRILHEEGGETDFLIDETKTVISDLNGFTDFNSLKVGDSVEVYFLKPLIITLQYPPRYTASAVVVRNKDNPGSAFVGVVNKDGRASDGSIVLNISDATEITRQSDGKKAGKDSISGKSIIAYFAITTRSMPPQALVTKVIVLDKLGLPIFVNGARVYAYDAEAIVNGDGVILAPLRAVVEALGYDVSWDDAEQAARVGVAIYVKIGSDEYTVGRAMPLKLEAAAVLKYGRTYVPLSFFTSIAQMELDDSNGLIKLSGKMV